MARKTGKPKPPKRTTKTKRAAKSGAKVRRARVVPEPVVGEESEIDLDTEAAGGKDKDTPIEVSEFRPVESTDDDEPATSAEPDADNENDKAADRKDRGALVATDPLGRYLAEIRRFPLLSREEEAVIARRYIKNKDPEDAYRLVTANLRLVVKLAYEFARATRNVLDLIQEGNVGLMEAVKNFDPEHGIRFPSYAVWWVRAYIYRYLINNWRLVKIGTTQAQRKLFFNLRKETERLEREGSSRSLCCWRIGWACARATCARCRSGWARARCRSINRPEAARIAIRGCST